MRAGPFVTFSLGVLSACGSRTGLIAADDAGVATIDASPTLGVLCAQSAGEVQTCAPDSETGPIERCTDLYPVCVRGNVDWGPSQDGPYVCCMKSDGLDCAMLGDCQ